MLRDFRLLSLSLYIDRRLERVISFKVFSEVSKNLLNVVETKVLLNLLINYILSYIL